MKIVGLTGGIASGKSTVARLFMEIGADFIDADKISKELTSSGGKAIEPIKEAFGIDVIDSGGGLDRGAVRKIVFENREKLLLLESIIHPMVFQAIIHRTEDLAKNGRKGVIVEIPLLFETNIPMEFSAVIVVVCDMETRIERVKSRDGFDEEEIRRVMANQLSDREKISRADYVIENNGSLEKTSKKVNQVWKEILRK